MRNKKISVNILSRAIVIALQLVNIKLYTEVLSIDQLGIFFFILSFSYIFNAILFVPVESFQQTKVHDEMDRNKSIYKVYLLSKDITVIYFVFTFFVAIFTYILFDRYLEVVFLSLILSYLIYLVQFLRNSLNNLEYGDFVSSSYIFESILKVGIFYFMIKFMMVNELYLLTSWIVSLFLTSLLLLLFATRVRLFNYISTKKYKVKEIYRFGYPISIGAVFNWAQLQGYRMILVPLGYAELVGFYATLSNIGSSVIGAFSLIYNHQFIPKLYKTKGDTLWSFIAGGILLITVSIFTFFLAGEVFINMIVGEGFSQYWWIVSYGILVDGVNLLIGAFSVYIMINGNTFSTIYPSIVAIVALILMYSYLYFFEKIEVHTVGIPIIIAQFILAIMLMRLCRKR